MVGGEYSSWVRTDTGMRVCWRQCSGSTACVCVGYGGGGGVTCLGVELGECTLKIRWLHNVRLALIAWLSKACSVEFAADKINSVKPLLIPNILTPTDTNNLELAQMPQVKEQSPTRPPHFRHQSKVLDAQPTCTTVWFAKIWEFPQHLPFQI